MSFITGLAEGLAEGIKRNNAAYQQEKRDLMNLSYKSYMSNQARREAKKEEEEKNARLTKALMTRHGIESGAFNNVYELVSAGMSSKEVSDMLSSGSFKKRGDQPAAPVSEQTSQALAAQVDPRQTQEQEAPQPMQSATPSPVAPSQKKPEAKKPTESGGLLPALSGIMFPKATPEKVQSEASSKIAAATGSSQEEVMSTMRGDMPRSAPRDTGGYEYIPNPRRPDLSTPGNIVQSFVFAEHAYKNNPTEENAINLQLAMRAMDVDTENKMRVNRDKASAERMGVVGNRAVIGASGKFLGFASPEQIQVDANGQEFFEGNPVRSREILKEEVDRSLDIAKSLQPEVNSIRERESAFERLVDYSQIQSEIVAKHPNVLQANVSGISQFFDALMNEVNAGKNVVNKVFEQGDFDGAKQQLEHTFNTADRAVAEAARTGEPARILAAERSKFEALANLKMYEIARIQKNSLRTEKERNDWWRALTAGRDQATFDENTANLLVPIATNLERDKAAIVDNNTEAKKFKDFYQYSPIEDLVPQGLPPVLREGRLGEYYNRLSQTFNNARDGQRVVDGANSNVVGNQGATPQPTSGQVAAPTPQGETRRVRINRAALDELRQNPTPENIQMFMEAFGVDPTPLLQQRN